MRDKKVEKEANKTTNRQKPMTKKKCHHNCAIYEWQNGIDEKEPILYVRSLLHVFDSQLKSIIYFEFTLMRLAIGSNNPSLPRKYFHFVWQQITDHASGHHKLLCDVSFMLPHFEFLRPIRANGYAFAYSLTIDFHFNHKISLWCTHADNNYRPIDL